MSMARQIGEDGFDKEPTILKMITMICHDSNYKIRIDGALFYKEYLTNPKALGSNRFLSTYLPELIELMNDEEQSIRIEAIEIATEILERLSLT